MRDKVLHDGVFVRRHWIPPLGLGFAQRSHGVSQMLAL